MPGHDLQGLVDRRAIAVLIVIPAYWEVRRSHSYWYLGGVKDGLTYRRQFAYLRGST